MIWGSGWDPLLAADKSGLLLQRMEEGVDGEYQDFKSKNGAYVREHFFGKYPELLDLVKDMTDDQIWALARGGHDPLKVYAAYKAAVDNVGTPTVILAKTVKGYGMGEAGEGQNITHQQKKMGENVLRAFRDRFGIDLPDEKIAEVPFLRLAEGSREHAYLRGAARGSGRLPARPASDQRDAAGAGAGRVRRAAQAHRGAEISTTMAFVRVLSTLLRDKQIGRRVVPIVPDESRTFGMEGMFRQFGILSQVGQLYRPEDANQLMYYKEDRSGQMLQEGINEAGAMSSWIAAATSYSVSDTPMIPFYVYYSMFGFQRIGDLAWAAGDSRARGFLMGGTAGRTTLNGEGLQHEDGHSPPDLGDDPELRVLRPDLRLRGRGDHPGRAAADVRRAGGRLLLPHHHERELLPPRHARGPGGRGGRRHPPRDVPAAESGLTPDGARRGPRVQLLGSGHDPARGEAAAALLERTSGWPRTCGAATSFTELARDGIDADRWNMLHPGRSRGPGGWRSSWPGARPVRSSPRRTTCGPSPSRSGPRCPDRRYRVLGTDGYGRSDYRRVLRGHFEVDRHYVVARRA